jgi:hypothetical protein
VHQLLAHPAKGATTTTTCLLTAFSLAASLKSASVVERRGCGRWRWGSTRIAPPLTAMRQHVRLQWQHSLRAGDGNRRAIFPQAAFCPRNPWTTATGSRNSGRSLWPVVRNAAAAGFDVAVGTASAAVRLRQRLGHGGGCTEQRCREDDFHFGLFLPLYESAAVACRHR